MALMGGGPYQPYEAPKPISDEEAKKKIEQIQKKVEDVKEKKSVMIVNGNEESEQRKSNGRIPSVVEFWMLPWAQH